MIGRILILLLGWFFIGCTPAPVAEPELAVATRAVLTREVETTPINAPTSTWTVTPVIADTATAVPMQTPSSTPLPSPTPISTLSAVWNPTNTPLPSSSPVPSPTPWPTPETSGLPIPETSLLASSIRAVAFLTEDFAWGVGENGYIGYWDSHKWTQIASPTQETLNDVEFIASDNGWAVGENLTLLHWDGYSWTLMYTYGERPYYNYVFEAVDFASPTEIWAVGLVDSEGGSGSYIARWQKIDNQWQAIESGHGCYCVFTDIVMLSPQDGWIVGINQNDLSALTLHWDGNSWEFVPNPGSAAGSWLYSVSAVSSNNVWALGLSGGGTYGSSVVYQWSGTDWLEKGIRNMGLTRILMTAEDYGVVIGYLRLHCWDGRTWIWDPEGDAKDIFASPSERLWLLTNSGQLRSFACNSDNFDLGDMK